MAFIQQITALYFKTDFHYQVRISLNILPIYTLPPNPNIHQMKNIDVKNIGESTATNLCQIMQCWLVSMLESMLGNVLTLKYLICIAIKKHHAIIFKNGFRNCYLKCKHQREIL